MLTQHHTPVCLSVTAYDLPIWSILETKATLYQREPGCFHILLTEPLIQDGALPIASPTPRLLWLEIASDRAVMTMQGNGRFSYRHAWEKGAYGLSRYWLQSSDLNEPNQIRIRNFTRSFFLKGKTLPRHLRIEYELWTHQLQVGHYVLNLEIRL